MFTLQNVNLSFWLYTYLRTDPKNSRNIKNNNAKNIKRGLLSTPSIFLPKAVKS